MPSLSAIDMLKVAGVTDDELDELRADASAQSFAAQEKRDQTENSAMDMLKAAGVTDTEINEMMGLKPPDTKVIDDTINANFRKNAPEPEGTPAPQGTPSPNKDLVQSEKPAVDMQKVFAENTEQADSFFDAFEAGFDMSSAGLAFQRPDMVLPENASMFYSIASQVGTLAGDVPAMIAGGVIGGPVGSAGGAVIGGAAGSVIPGPGTLIGGGVGAIGGGVVGVGAGAFALPEGLRTSMMEYYANNDQADFEGFWARNSAALINGIQSGEVWKSATKAGLIGGATVGAGKLAGLGAKALGAGKVTKTSAEIATEVATMTTVGAALEGEAPSLDHFIEAGLVVSALRGTGMASKRLMQVYAKGGNKPADVAAAASQNPIIADKLMSEMTHPMEIVNMMEGRRSSAGIPHSIANPTIPKVSVPLPKPKLKRAELSPELNTILDKVVTKTEAPRDFSGKALKIEVADKSNAAYTNFVDRLHPLHQATKFLAQNPKELLAKDNPYMLGRMVVDHKAKAKHAFERGTLDFKTLATNGKGLTDILKKVENTDVLDAFLLARRTLEKHKQGIDLGFDLNASKAIVRNNSAKYAAAAKEFTSFSNRNLKYLEDSGILGRESRIKMELNNRDYAPIKRMHETVDGAMAGKAGKAKFLKQLKGGEGDVQSPITSLVENTVEIFKMAEVNRSTAKLIELAEANPEKMGMLLEKVPSQIQKVTVGQKEVAALLKKQGIDPALAEPMTTYRRLQNQLAPNEFQVYRNGKREVYRTTPELAESIKSLDGDAAAASVLLRLAAGVTRFKKITITAVPEFMVRNLMRDIPTGGVFANSKGLLTPIEVIKAMGNFLRKDEVYFNWLKAGGANGAFLEINTRYITKEITKLQSQTNFMASARNVLHKPLDFAKASADLAEQSVRLAIFKKVSGGASSGSILMEAGFSSREGTLDFQRMGAKMSGWNSMTAFSNVGIQGIDRITRSAKDNPKAFSARVFTYLTAPGILMWLTNKDDQRYQDLPRWEKDKFIHLLTDDWQEVDPEEVGGVGEHMVRTHKGKTFLNKGTIYRLPLPQVLGELVVGLPIRTLELLANDKPDAFKDFSESFMQAFVPNFIPDIAIPFAEHNFNENFFTGSAIVPQHIAGAKSEYQHAEYTTETAKTIGKLIPSNISMGRDKLDFASPMVIDNYIRSWTGAVGRYTLQAIDEAVERTGSDPEKATMPLSDIPFVRAFVSRFPTAGTKNIQDFYDNLDKTRKVRATINLVMDQGDINNILKEQEDFDNRIFSVNLDGFAEAIGKQREAIKFINSSEELTKDEKRHQIDILYLEMNQAAVQGNEMINIMAKVIDEERMAQELLRMEIDNKGN